MICQVFVAETGSHPLENRQDRFWDVRFILVHCRSRVVLQNVINQKQVDRPVVNDNVS